MWNKRDSLLVLLIVFSSFLAGHTLAKLSESKEQVSYEYAKSIENFGKFAKARDWTVIKKHTNQIFDEYIVRIDSGPKHKVQVMTMRDPLGEVRTIIVSKSLDYD